MATLDEIMGKSPYGADLYQRGNESLYDYFSRIRGAENRAGLLGWRLGADPFAESVAEPEKELSASEELGKLIKKQTESSGPSDYENALGIPKPEYTSASAKNMSLEDMARQMAGVDFDPTYLLGAIPFVGGPAAGLAQYLRSSEVQNRLKDMGYSQAQIEAMINDPSILMSELGTNSNAGFVKPFDPLEVDGRGLFTRLTDSLGITDRVNPDVTAASAGLFGPHSAYVMQQEMANSPFLTATPQAIAGSEAAIQRKMDAEQELARQLELEALYPTSGTTATITPVATTPTSGGGMLSSSGAISYPVPQYQGFDFSVGGGQPQTINVGGTTYTQVSDYNSPRGSVYTSSSGGNQYGGGGSQGWSPA